MISFAIGANNAPFRRVLAQTQALGIRSVRATAIRMTAIGTAAGLGIVGAVRGISRQMGNVIGGIGRQFDMAGRLNDMSVRTRMLAGDLMLLEQAFKENSLEVAAVGPSITKLNRQLYGASQGAKSSRALFTGLGLSWQWLEQQSPYDRFVAVAKAMAGVADETERAALATTLFGRSGDSMQALFANIGSLDQIKSDLAPQVAALNASAAKMDEAGDRIDRFKRIFEGFYLGVAVKIADSISSIVGSLSGASFYEKGEGFGKMLTGAVESVTKIVRLLSGAFSNPRALLGDLGAMFRVLFMGVGQGLKAAFLFGLVALAKGLNVIVASFTGKIADVMSAIPGMGEAAEKVRASGGGMDTSSIEAAAGMAQKTTGEIFAAVGAMASATARNALARGTPAGGAAPAGSAPAAKAGFWRNPSAGGSSSAIRREVFGLTPEQDKLERNRLFKSGGGGKTLDTFRGANMPPELASTLSSQYTGGVQSAVGGLKNPHGLSGLGGGSVRHGDAGSRRRAAEAEKRAKAEEARKANDPAERTAKGVEETNRILSEAFEKE